MVIMHIITTIDVGGAEVHLLKLSDSLIKEGHNVHVVYLKGDGTLQEEFEKIGVSPQKVSLSGFFQLWMLMRKIRPDIVHTHLLKADFMGGLAAALAGIRGVVSTKHNDEPQLENFFYRFLHRIPLFINKKVIAVSNHIRTYMVHVAGVNPQKIETVYIGIDPSPPDSIKGSSIRQELGLGSEPFLVGSVARLIERKGHQTLLEAFALISKEIKNIKLLIIGGGPHREKLEEMSTQLKVDHDVYFLGERRDIGAILSELQLFVLASVKEGFGLVLLEAMSAGVPILACRSGGIEEAVEDGETGILTTPSNPKALAEQMKYLVQNKDVSRIMGQNGRKKVRTFFSLEKMKKNILEIYKKAL